MEDLKKYSLVYVATPYSKFPGGLESAFIEASRVTAKLIGGGVKAYSPIAHGHPIAIHGNIDPYDHDIWLPFDSTMMEKSDAVVVVKMDGWSESRGVTHEIETFHTAGKPVFYLDPITCTVIS